MGNNAIFNGSFSSIGSFSPIGNITTNQSSGIGLSNNSHTHNFPTLSTTSFYIDENCNYDKPFNTIEKDNCKILQYEVIGLNKSLITVNKNFINKTKVLNVEVYGKYIDDLTGWKNDIKIKLQVDYNIYNKVTWNINDGILNIILHEIINTEPDVVVEEE